MKGFKIFLYLTFFLLASGNKLFGESRWSVGYFGGIYHPLAKTIERHGVWGDSNFHNEKLKYRTGFGVEAQWDMDPKFSLSLSVASWEGNAKSSINGIMNFESDLYPNTPYDATRDLRISINQYWLIWKYNLLKKESKYKFYIDTGFFGFLNAYLFEDYKYVFHTKDGDFFRFVSNKANSYGRHGGMIGLGGQVFFARVFSITVDGQYIFGKVKYLLYKYSIYSCTPVDDFCKMVFPKEIPVTYTDGNGRRSLLELNLDGWRLTTGINIHF